MFLFRRLDLKNYSTKIKKAMVLTAALSTFSIHHAVSAEETSDITTIFHVYKNEQFIGSITEEDKQTLDQHLTLKVEQLKKSYPTYNLEVDQDVTYIPEKVFQTPEEMTNIVESLKNDIQVEARVQALVIDGKEEVYLPTKEAIDQLLRKFKLQFVTEAELAQYEKRTLNDDAPLTSVGSKVRSIELSKEINVVDSAALPNQVLTEEEALNYLNNGAIEAKMYSVKEGDVLGSIAQAYQLTTKELLALNPGLKEDSLLKIGQAIQVKTAKPVLQVSVVREVFKEQVVPFEKKVEESASLNKGETKIKQEGQNGQKELHYMVKQTNGTQVSQNIISDTVTKQPVAEVRVKGTKETPSRGSGKLTWPTVGGYVSSETGYRWGKKHKGIDIARPSNRTIKAADNGVVVSAGWNSGGYGNKIVIDHGNGMRTIYAHLDSISVRAGQTVSAGSKIGIMGSTGNSTGVHLHFELYVNGSLANPLTYL